ncbi:MAG TPA: DUF3791 domain-containing protein [Clostridia bacterium]|jgi:hypothetical protein|nr:MAG: hypothetical protein BWX78_00751 [Firmicutes bacterium ADurb.Bin099]HNZ40906.1 DUF3791 domain-containing protein [Clostridia bacterium]HPY98155.1 DUF3791 domain-containing protein [Clostridia bacterium]HQC68096.1 DUF3791 domain-containing protein [Clostridia bacterium]
MKAHPILLQKKYARIVEQFAKKQGIEISTALDFFYGSMVYVLMSEGISDFHCMSDTYIVDELIIEYSKALKKNQLDK